MVTKLQTIVIKSDGPISTNLLDNALELLGKFHIWITKELIEQIRDGRGIILRIPSRTYVDSSMLASLQIEIKGARISIEDT